MRLLKNKISRAALRLQASVSSSDMEQDKKLSQKFITSQKNNIRNERITPLCYKNITKNYGRAICSFALTVTADEYVIPLCRAIDVSPRGLRRFIQENKENVTSIDGFRNMIMVTQNDTEEVAKFKKVFQKVSEIFMKYFSVNWIFSSKLSNKMLYLRMRFKLIRRIQNPEQFTHLK